MIILCYTLDMRKYFKHKIKSLLVVNRIVAIHYLEQKERFHDPEEKHNFWEIICALKGNISCTQHDKTIAVNEGNVIFHKPNLPHSLTVPKQEQSGVFVISFDCSSEAMRFFSDRIIQLTPRQIKYIYQIIEIAKRTYDITFYNIETDIMQLLEHPTLGGEQLIKNLLETMLIDIMRSLTETAEGNDVFLQEVEINDKLTDDIVKMLKDNIYGSVTIEDICKKMSYSKAHVFRQFKRATEKSVMEYYLDLKIKEAKKLIREDKLNIKEIAEKLCFDTPNYFSKTFKKKTGKTPTEYKKTHV